MTILIIEDNQEMRRIIKTIVGDLAGAFEERADGSQAADAYDACRPDWVFMDVRLPGLDGIAATRQIRRRDPRARVVVVTQYDDQDLRRAAQNAGACGYVLKDNLLPLRDLLLAGGEQQGNRK